MAWLIYPTREWCDSAGVTHALASIFSFGQRQQLLSFAPQLWAEASKLLDSPTAASSVLARKFAIKLVQRIGLTFLPAIVASWRYQQTNVNINESLKAVTVNSVQSTQPTANAAAHKSSADKSDAADGQAVQQTPAALAGEVQRPALQPSPYVNMHGPLSQAAIKADHAAHTTQQQHGAAEHRNAAAADDVRTVADAEDDVEVPDEIEEV